MLKISSFAKWGAAVLLLSSLTSCEDILEQYFPKPNPTPPTIPAQPVAYMAYSPQAGGNILRVFNPSTLATTREVPITGLSASDQLLSLDLRPATGQLYALTGTNVPATEPFTRPTITGGQLYTINPATGVATLVAPLSISLQGFSQFGFDFNPIADRIRIVSDQGQNLRVNPEDGTVIVDGVIRSPSGTSAIVGDVAYDNNLAGATSTNLYLLDINEDALFLQNPPNSGTLTLIGRTRMNEAVRGFDIGGASNTAYAVIIVSFGLPAEAATTHLFSVNLSTGALTDLGDLGLPAATRTFIPIPRGFTLGAGF